MTSPPSEIVDPQLEAALGELGQPAAEFKPATGNIIAWMIIFGSALLAGLAALTGGLYWAANHGFNFPVVGAPKNQPDWAKVGILLMAGISLTFLGIVWLPIKWRELSGRLYVCPRGFVRHRRSGKVDVFCWDDIEKVLQDYVDSEKHRVEDGPPMKVSTTFLVKRKDGGEFGFGQDSLQNHRQFARLLFAEAQARGIPWEFYVPK